MGALSPLDPSSYSRPELAVIRHIFLSLLVDFHRSVIDGEVELQFEALENVDNVVLDSSDLTIKTVKYGNGEELTFKLEDYIKDYGSRLTVNLPECVGSGIIFKVVITYETSPKARALQWLDASQTSGKRHPYMFSQCQPIHARTLLPCQDTPNVKFTYDASVVAASELTVLMSALRDDDASPAPGGRRHSFHQRVPIPSYLIAIVVGDLQARRLAPRSLMWSEKEVIDASAFEFDETEQMLQTAEHLCGPYVWEQYNLLVLPPSFPFGGMENPCLTFVTPTLLAGDRSLADVVVHEIMHSWTGNLVTNANFEHFWLNEGFTVFLERKVTSALEAARTGEDPHKIRDFLSILGLQELNDTVNNVLGASSPLTHLVVNLADVHPDDAFSLVPYEKGSLFLRYLEDIVGGPATFDVFVRSYLNKFSRKSLTTEDFKVFFEDYFRQNCAIQEVDWDAWLNKPGVPIIIPKYDTTMAQECTDLAQRWQQNSTATFSADDLSKFTVQQVIKFLQELLTLATLPADTYDKMEKLYKFDKTGNSEIKMRWLRLGIRAGVQCVIPKALEFVNSQGRMKFIRPIYRDLYAWAASRERAIDNFLKNEQYYMHVAAFTVRKDLHLP